VDAARQRRRGRPPGYSIRRVYPSGAVRWTGLYQERPGGRYLSAGTFDTMREADLAWMEKAVVAGRLLPSDPRRELTPFADFVDRYFEQVVFNSGNTKQTYHYVARAHLIPAFGDRALRDVDREAVAA